MRREENQFYSLNNCDYLYNLWHFDYLLVTSLIISVIIMKDECEQWVRSPAASSELYHQH